jgi:nucleoside-diphosphate-sugar epimerase
MMETCLVTGGSGFIGSSIAKYLVESGYKVKVFDDGSRGRIRRLAGIEGDIELISGDIQDSAAVSSACKRVNKVFHLAYINGTNNFYSQPQKILDVAIMGISNILTGIRENGIQEIYLASSSEVYQEPYIFPTPETIPMVVPDAYNPRYSYGLGKIIQEFLTIHSRDVIRKKIIFRPHNIYGPDMGNLHVIPELFEKVRDAKEGIIEIKGTGDQKRTFCHIDDFIQAIELLLNTQVKSQTINIGTLEETTILDLAKTIIQTSKKDLAISTSEAPNGETNRRVPDISKISSLGFKQRVELSEGLNTYWNWFKNQSKGGVS